MTSYKEESDISLALTTSSPVPDTETAPVLTAAVEAFSKNISYRQVAVHAAAEAASLEEALLQNSPLTMLPNYSIHATGHEHGQFLVVDLGGSTLRVALISILPEDPAQPRPRAERIVVETSRKWLVDNTNKVVDQRFFAWACDRIAEVVPEAVRASPNGITAGITWLFSLKSTAYNLANILHMAKGYTVAPEIYGQDLRRILEDTLWTNHRLRVNVQSIVNDSLAVFAAGSFLDDTTKLALVLGTGLNVCCQLPASDRIVRSKLLDNEAHVLFNTELSLFGSSLLGACTNKYDAAIDRRFAAPPAFVTHMEVDPADGSIFQPFELLAAGRYLPELVRLVLVDMAAEGEIFAAQKNLAALQTPYTGITGQFLCCVAQGLDSAAVACQVEELLQWAPGTVLPSDVSRLRLLVDSVVQRSAFIVAVALVAFLKLLHAHNVPFTLDVVTIGYVGLVMEYFHGLRSMTTDFVNSCSDVQAMGVRIKLERVTESSLVGAAIAAASRV